MKVATGGCFDIFHVGHADFLRRIYNLFGVKVEVFMNSNDSIRRLKGNDRPINGEARRRIVLEAIKYVEHVWVFNEDTPCDVINIHKPEVWVKGGDYRIEDLPETKIIESYGG